ncbi:YiiG family protein [Winogradskyella eckloniae]|uniref:YiiG family protein n=1 Tax=Winogradskyella eckloniae TaxID=1089306 RepID=UPI0015633121|nr:YiiG family protein [Winogradskyella eckloniae]NRD18575.1 YiiG family protein [Winogradskyella eckloniae]
MKKLILSCLVLLSIVTSCNEEKKAATTERVSAETLNKFETKEFIDKYNIYIGFGNRFDKNVGNSYERYFKWADYEKGPSANSKRIGGVTTLSNSELEKLEKAIAQYPEIEEVDDLMKAVLKDATYLQTTLDKADSYYQKQDYKDDDFALGKDLHKDLVKAFENYYKSYDLMYVNFKGLQNSLKEFEAHKYKENGELIRYNLMMELNKADQVFDVIGNLDGENLKSIDIKELKAKLADFRTVHNALESQNKDETQKTKEFGKTSIAKSFLPTFIREGNSFIRETRQLIERIEKNDFDYGITHPSIAASGSPLKLRKVYGNLVTYYNRMN